MSAILNVHTSKIPNVRVEKGGGGGGGKKKGDKESLPQRSAADGENTACFLSRQSSTSSDRESVSSGAREKQQAPRGGGTTKALGGGTKVAGPPGAGAASRAVRSPLSKINAHPSSRDPKPTGGGRGGDAKGGDPKARLTPQSGSKPTATPHSVVSTSEPPFSSSSSSQSSKDGLDSNKGGSRTGLGTTGSPRQGIPGPATRVGSVPVNPRPATTRGPLSSAPPRKTGAGAKTKNASVTPESPQGPTPVLLAKPEPLSKEQESNRPGPIPKGSESIPNGPEPALDGKETESKPKEPEPSEPNLKPKESELVDQLHVITEERDKLAKALTDREEEFRAKERDLLHRLQAASGAQAQQVHLSGEGIDGSAGSEKEEEEEEDSTLQEGTVVRAGCTNQSAREMEAVSLATSAVHKDDGGDVVALLKVEELEAIQKEREMVILRGEQEIARLQLELQNSEQQLAQCRRQLELLSSQGSKQLTGGPLEESVLSPSRDTKPRPTVDTLDGPHPDLGNNKQINNDHEDSHGDQHHLTVGKEVKGCNGVHGDPRVGGATEPLQHDSKASGGTSRLVQWCKALLVDDWEGPLDGTGEEAALVEIIKGYRERMEMKLRAAEGRCQQGAEGVWSRTCEEVDNKAVSKGKLFRSDAEPLCPEKDAKRIKPSDGSPSVPSGGNRLLKQARRRSGGNGSGTRPKSLDGPQTNEQPEPFSAAACSVDSSSLLISGDGSSLALTTACDFTAAPSNHLAAEGLNEAALAEESVVISSDGGTPRTSVANPTAEGVHSLEVSMLTSVTSNCSAVEAAGPALQKASSTAAEIYATSQSTPLSAEPLKQAVELEMAAQSIEVQLEIIANGGPIEAGGVPKPPATPQDAPADDAPDGGWISLTIPRVN